MKKIQDLTQGSPFRLLMTLAVPICLGYIFNQIYSIADSIIVGRALGVNALAAVGATSSLNNLFCSIVIGTTVGAGVIVGQYFGNGKKEDTASAITNSTYFNVIISLILMLVSIPFAKVYLRLFKTPEIILDDAAIYMQVYLSGILFMTLYYMTFGILRSFGDARTPLYFMILSSVVNIGLDLLFIYAFRLGVFGAALATTVSQGIACILCIVYSIRTNSYFALAVKNYRINFSMIKDCAKIGMSLGIQQALIYLSNSILQGVINGYGEITIAAFAVTSKLELVITQPVYAWSNAVTAFTSQNMGARKTSRVERCVAVSMLTSIVYSALILILFIFFGKFFVGAFVTDNDVIETGKYGILIEAAFVFGFCINQIIKNVLTGAGDTAFPLYAGIVEIVARISLTFGLTAVPFIGIWGIWFTTGITWCIVGFYILLRYRRGKWKEYSLVK